MLKARNDDRRLRASQGAAVATLALDDAAAQLGQAGARRLGLEVCEFRDATLVVHGAANEEDKGGGGAHGAAAAEGSGDPVDGGAATAATDGGITIFRDFDWRFERGDRVGVVGPNGSGKSSFLDALTGTGTTPFASGEIVRGETVTVGYYRQHAAAQLPAAARVLAWACDVVAGAAAEAAEVARRAAKRAGGVNGAAAAPPLGGDGIEREARALLTRFQFGEARWRDRVGALSGGEQRRLQVR